MTFSVDMIVTQFSPSLHIFLKRQYSPKMSFYPNNKWILIGCILGCWPPDLKTCFYHCSSGLHCNHKKPLLPPLVIFFSCFGRVRVRVRVVRFWFWAHKLSILSSSGKIRVCHTYIVTTIWPWGHQQNVIFTSILNQQYFLISLLSKPLQFFCSTTFKHWTCRLRPVFAQVLHQAKIHQLASQGTAYHLLSHHSTIHPKVW